MPPVKEYWQMTQFFLRITVIIRLGHRRGLKVSNEVGISFALGTLNYNS